MLQKRNRTLQYYVNTGENPLEIRTQQNLLYIHIESTDRKTMLKNSR